MHIVSRLSRRTGGRALRRALAVLLCALALIRAEPRAAEPGPAPDVAPFAPALAMHGAPALPPDFAHLPYAAPDAPVGGALRLGERGGFDSLHAFTLRGRSHGSVREHVVESLMTRSWDEPFTLYGLLADGVSTPSDRSEVSFRLDPAARFSNGAPVTVEDVLFSYETLRAQGRPNHRSYYAQVARAEAVGDRIVRFVFEKPNRELPLLLGLMPILAKADWAGRDFSEPRIEPILGSGPYVVDAVTPGRSIRLRRDPDYWAAERPINRGRHRFETIEYQFFRDAGALWEAFTAGALDLYQDGDPAHWAEAYDLPTVADGRIRKTEIAHARASGMEGFVFNTRRAPFADRRVREALALALDFAWINQRFYRGGFARITSYFAGSSLGFRDPAGAGERALLASFVERLPEGILEQGWRPPEGAGDGRNRADLRRARALLEEAGWRVVDGALRDAEGRPFTFEVLLAASGEERMVAAFAEALARLGIEARARLVDAAQHQARLETFDYDMIVHRWHLSLSPGEEQRFYWGSAAAETPGSRNYMGVADPAVDAMIDALLAAETRPEFEDAARALDRALSAGVYVVPFGYQAVDRVAHAAWIGKPARDALYGLRLDVLFARE